MDENELLANEIANRLSKENAELRRRMKELELKKEPYLKCDVCLGKPLVSGKLCICGGEGTVFGALDGFRKRCFELETRLKELEQELKGYQKFKESVDEALNRGDGSYRP